MEDVKYIEYKCKIGSHMPLENKLFDTLKNAHDLGMNCIQFFLGNYLSYNKKSFTKEDQTKSLEFIKRFPMNVYIHSSYVYNLCGSKDCLAWIGDGDDEKIMKTLNAVEKELLAISKFKTNGVIIHPGCYNNRKLGLETIAKSINKINFPDNSKLLLENCAGEGSKLCSNFNEIKTIYDLVDPLKQKHVGVCVDTAHIFGAGLYDLSKSEQVEKMFKDFNDIIGLDKLSLIHLNDSKVEYNSKKDRHELLGTGYIWGRNTKALKTLLNLCEVHNIPIILETDPSDMEAIYKLKSDI